MAQLVRAPPCHGGGRGFESRLGRSGSLAQLGEHLPYKQRVTGSSPVGPISHIFLRLADVAQLAEQLICNQQVIGSSPIIGFIQFNIELYYGQIPEWPKGTDCKSAATCFGGSNPPLPIIIYAGVAELADAQDLKSCCSDTVPVRFRSPAFIERALDKSVIIDEKKLIEYVCVAQLDRALGYGPRCREFESSRARI